MSGKFKLNVVICGMSGLVGSKLYDFFISKHCDVEGISIRENTPLEDIATKIKNCDILINLSGVTILARWSESYKKRLYSSRIDTTKKLVDAIEICKDRPKLFLSASAVGIYESNLVHNDSSQNYADDFLAHLCLDWETQAKRADEFGVRSVQTRFGVIYAKDGGAITKMLPPFKLGVGGKLGSGNQMVSWIHIDDLVSAIDFIIKTPAIRGSVNFTSPKPLSNSQQTQIMGNILNRSTFFTVPAFAIKLIFGEGSVVMLDSKEVYPSKLLENGFIFKYENFEDAFHQLV